MSLDPNFVLFKWVMIVGETAGLIHGSCDRLGVNNSKIQTDVGSCCPHIWGFDVGIYEDSRFMGNNDLALMLTCIEILN